MSQPLVSIIIPVYNSAPFVAEAVQSALDQTWPHKEVIVVDDGSTDGSVAVVKKFADQVQLVAIPHSGAPAARNEGIRWARGEYIKFLDADDVLLPDAVSQLMQAVGSLPEHAIPYGQVLAMDTREPLFTGIRTSLTTTKDDMILACFSSNIPTTAPLYRASVLRTINGFDPHLERGQEWDLHLRLALHGVIFCYVENVVSLIRSHTGKDRINIRIRGIAGVELRSRSVIRGVELIQEYYGHVIPRQFREVMYRHYHTLARGYARWGQHRKAQYWFDLARSLDIEPPKVGSLPYRVLRPVLGDYRAMRALSTVHEWVLGSLLHRMFRRIVGNSWDSKTGLAVRGLVGDG